MHVSTLFAPWSTHARPSLTYAHNWLRPSNRTRVSTPSRCVTDGPRTSCASSASTHPARSRACASGPRRGRHQPGCRRRRHRPPNLPEPLPHLWTAPSFARGSPLPTGGGRDPSPVAHIHASAATRPPAGVDHLHLRHGHRRRPSQRRRRPRIRAPKPCPRAAHFDAIATTVKGKRCRLRRPLTVVVIAWAACIGSRASEWLRSEPSRTRPRRADVDATSASAAGGSHRSTPPVDVEHRRRSRPERDAVR